MEIESTEWWERGSTGSGYIGPVAVFHVTGYGSVYSPCKREEFEALKAEMEEHFAALKDESGVGEGPNL